MTGLGVVCVVAPASVAASLWWVAWWWLHAACGLPVVWWPRVGLHWLQLAGLWSLVMECRVAPEVKITRKKEDGLVSDNHTLHRAVRGAGG